jgi:hypothetical protein
MDTAFQRLLSFLDGLEQEGIVYTLQHVRESLMVATYLPEGYCEVEFFADGSIEVEWYRRGEGVEQVGADWLDWFLAAHRD